VHAVPAAQVLVLSPLHFTVQAVVPPQTTLQLAVPSHAAVHPPAGQSRVQVLVPVQETVDPVPTVTLQLLPPAQLTVLLVPVWRVQLLVPAQVEVQFELQLLWQVDWPSQVVVQPVPQVALQVFFELQS
jgi:hypothetical protein